MKQKVVVKEEVKVVPSYTAGKLEFAINSLYEKVSNHTGKSIPELKKSILIIKNGEITIK